MVVVFLLIANLFPAKTTVTMSVCMTGNHTILFDDFHGTHTHTHTHTAGKVWDEATANEPHLHALQLLSSSSSLSLLLILLLFITEDQSESGQPHVYKQNSTQT